MWTSIAALVLALPQSQLPVEQKNGGWERLETMTRLYQQKLKGAFPSPLADVPLVGSLFGETEGRGATLNASDERSALLGFYGARMPSATEARSEYVPGLGAIFSLEAALPCEVVETEAGASQQGAASTKSDVDAEWQAAANGLPFGAATETRSTVRDALFAAAKEQQPAVKLRFVPAAIEALQKTLVETTWRFGHKLELARSERVAIVVVLRRGFPGALNHPDAARRKSDLLEASADGVESRVWGDANTVDPRQWGGAADSAVSRFLAGSFRNVVGPEPMRIVIQVAASDLEALRAGNLEPDETAKRTRIERY